MKLRIHLLPFLSLLLVVAVAFVLRMYRLDQSPSGALIDEAHFGYLAKSLIVSGKDEHGVSWPLVFRGFGDQKLPGYAYLMIPFVAIWDVSVMTIRLPSVMVGTLSVLLMYILARRIGFSTWLSWLGAVMMAVSPWPFFLSRFGFESNLALFFWIIGLIGLVEVVKQKPVAAQSFWKNLAPAVIAGLGFAATWYCYIAYRPVTALTLIGMGVVSLLWYRHALRGLLVSAVVFAIFVTPFFLPSVSAANTARLQQVGLLSDAHNARVIDEYRTFCDFQLPLPLCSLIWNKGTYVVQTVASRFLHTYSPEYLATNGEANELFLTVKHFGQFVMVLYPLVWLGLAEVLVLRKKLQLTEWLVIIGLVVAPLPTILAGEPQKVRLSELLPFLILLMLYGIHALSQLLDRVKVLSVPPVVVKAGVACVVLGLATTATISYFVDFYTVHTIKNDYMYQSYVRELFPKLKAEYPDQHILIKPFFSDPTMFYAFYTMMDPREYQRQAVLGPLEASGFQHTVAIDAVRVWDSGFQSAACEAVAQDRPSFYVTDEAAQGVDVVPVFTVKSANGAMTYVHVYDALTSGKLSVMECNDIPLAMRQEIAKQVEESGLRQKVVRQ